MSRHKYAVEEWTYNWMDRNASGTRPHQGSLYTNLMGHCMQRQRMNQAEKQEVQTRPARRPPRWVGAPGQTTRALTRADGESTVRRMEVLDAPLRMETPRHVRERSAASLQAQVCGWSQAIARTFHLLDTNQNGSLEPEEITAVHGGDSDGFFKLLDINHDGKVTFDEFDAFCSGLKNAKDEETAFGFILYLGEAAEMVHEANPEQACDALQRISATVSLGEGHSSDTFDSAAWCVALAGFIGIPSDFMTADWMEGVLSGHGTVVVTVPPHMDVQQIETKLQSAEGSTLAGVVCAELECCSTAVQQVLQNEHQPVLLLARVRALFKVLDIDDNWKLDRDEIVRVMHGGDGVGFFEELCATDDNMVPLDGWESFFAQFIEAKGPEATMTFIESLERGVRIVMHRQAVQATHVLDLQSDDIQSASVPCFPLQHKQHNLLGDIGTPRRLGDSLIPAASTCGLNASAFVMSKDRHLQSESSRSPKQLQASCLRANQASASATSAAKALRLHANIRKTMLC